MKTIVNQQSLRKCEERLSLSFCSLLWQWVLGRFTHAKMTFTATPTIKRIARVVRDRSAGQSALLLSSLNRRIFAGLGMMGVVAPLASCFYMIFDRSVYDEAWYHVNYFYLFLLIGPSLFILVCLIGVWFLFPQGCKRAYVLVVPAGFTLGKILWLIQCTSNEDFYSVVPSSFILIGALISVFMFVACDWLAQIKFHREDAFEARLGTLYNGADLIEGEQFKSLFKKFVDEKKAFRKQF